MTTTYQLATFAGGCFWCMEPEFSNIDGVKNVLPGYMGGHVPNPTYEDICTGRSGHSEVVQLSFDPEKISYEALLEIFWRNVDPLDARGQFVDKGTQYLAGVFTHDETQRQQAEASKTAVQAKLGQTVESFVRPAEKFYVAEDYHQQYFLKNALRYKMYANGSGRKERLREVWEKVQIDS